MTDSTQSPSQDALGTARLLINSSASKEVEIMVAKLRAVTTLPMLCNEAADLLTRLSAERDRLEEALASKTTAFNAAFDGMVAQRDKAWSDEYLQRERAERAEAERDALKAALLQIADGTWNHGRACANALTYRQFAKRAAELHATLSDKVS